MSEPNAAAQFNRRIALANEAIDRRALDRLMHDLAEGPNTRWLRGVAPKIAAWPRDPEDEQEDDERFDTANEV